MIAIAGVKFRKALIGDVPELIELRINQLVDEGYPETRDIRKELNEYFLSSMENYSLICWVGIANEKVISTAGLCFYQLPPTFSNPTGKIAYITNMYTCDEYRGRGIASYLVDKLVDEAKAMKFLSVKLHASTHGKNIYEKAGFVVTEGYMGLKF
jgi:GNAT superfamily N-acetyltransferase